MASATLGSAQNHLPTELVLLVIGHLADDNATLCTLARTSRALQHLAEEHIYRTIELFTVRDLHDIIEAFTYRHQRIRAVQTLRLQYHYNVKDLEDNVDMRDAFNECVAHMVNLREWHIESPYDNCHWNDGDGPRQWVEGDMERFRLALDSACKEGPIEADRIQAERKLGNVVDRTVGLALLQSLTIHSHGTDSDFWDLEAFHCVFRHPSLRHLHISCVTLTKDLPALQSHTSKTPLTSLVFDECELSPVSLHAILRTPARLKQLTLGENVWNTRRSKRLKPRLTQNVCATLEALNEVAHSLESLTHLDPSWKLVFDSHKARRMTPTGEGMRNFHALRFLQCETSSFLHQAIIMNREMAPPNLETLRLNRHWYVEADLFDHMPEIETYLALPSLSTLELMQASHCWIELSRPDYICDYDRVRNRHAYAYKLYKAGINLKVLIQMHRDDRIIPPYLYGETLPVTECLYDARKVGFRRHVRVQPDAEDDSEASLAKITREESLSEKLDPNHAPDTVPGEELQETDQLGGVDINIIKSDTHSTITNLKHRFIHHRGLRRASSILEFMDDDDEDDPFEIEVDEDMDEEEEYDIEMDEDGLDVVFHEQNGELYIEVYESETEDEDEGGEGHVPGLNGVDDLD